jgi:UDP-glucuronate decarboxylase
MSKLEMLDRIVPKNFLESTSLFEKENGPDVYITGSTGYVGRSLIETASFLSKYRRLKLNIWISERDAEKLQRHFLIRHSLNVMTTDLLLESEIDPHISHIIYLANPHFSENNPKDDKEIFTTSKIWIRNLIEHCSRNSSKRLIYASSGAVYNAKKYSRANLGFDEIDPIEIQNASSYAKLKIFAEEELMKAILGNNANVAIPRLFTFYGPNLPLDANFLIGNLMNSAISNHPISLKSNGTTRRSFMHSYEMSWRLLQILFSDFLGPINLGSSKPYSVSELADLFQKLFGVQYKLNAGSISESVYLPDTTLLEKKFGTSPDYSFTDSLTDWFREEKLAANG